MIFLRLALRNLRGAGIKTLLNSLALSFAFVAIILGQSLLTGMNKQAENASVAWEYGGGQFWQGNYDPYDPLSLDRSHATLPEELIRLVAAGLATPILVLPGTIYPQGRFLPVILKGITPEQKILAIPSWALADTAAELPLLIGARMARAAGLELGSRVTVQWRDRNGAFDAYETRIVHIFETSVTSVDMGQVWLPLDRLQKLTGMGNEATLVVLQKQLPRTLVPTKNVEGWVFRNLEFLLSDLRQVVRSKTAGQSIMFGILFLLAMLAIFDTQVLSVFRRRREIGMLIALGMTRGQVIALFTLEGSLYGVLAVFLGAVYGTPLFIYLSRRGLTFPGADGWGLAMSDTIYPIYPAGLILGTTLLVLVTAAFVSWLPARQIAKLTPVAALSTRTT